MDKKMIYFLLPDLSAGGAERVTITLARLLKKKGFEVTFINIGYNVGEMLNWISPEFKLISFGHSRVLFGLFSLIRFMKENKNGVYFSSREHVNIINLLASKVTFSDVVIRIPNMPYNKLSQGISGIKMRIIKFINKFLLPSASKVITQNEEMKCQVMDVYKLDREKIVCINNPIDKEYVQLKALESQKTFQKNHINFLTVCNISYAKGIDILLNSWPEVKKRLPNAHMYILGRDTSTYAKELKIKSNDLCDVHFMGFIENPYPYFKDCDVYVLPSRMEGFPNVVLEAMCFNKPIVATRCVDILKDLVKDGVNGFTCKVEDAQDLSECMIKSINLTDVTSDYDLFDEDKLVSCFKRISI